MTPADLAVVTRVPLGHYPTPVRRLERLSERFAPARLWVKSDDACADLYGGNKVRKLEHLLGEARERGARRLLTVGAAGSHHALATALFGRELGLEVDVILYPQAMNPHAQHNLERTTAAATRVVHVERVSAVPGLLASIDPRGGRLYFVPPGGSSPLGTVGFVEAGLELKAQFDAGLLPVPRRVFVPLGSGGTAAGLALGLAAVGLETQVVAVRVAPRAVANEPLVRLLMSQTRALLRRYGLELPETPARLVVEGRFLGAGYAHITPEGEEAVRLAREDGLELETTYTGKAFAALLEHARTRRFAEDLLFWNTVSSR